MDSGNSGSISSSGDEEYDSRPHHTILPSTFLNQTPFNPQQQSSLLSSSHQHHSLFDLSSTYLHPFSQPQPNSSNPNSFLNLDTGTQRSEPNCTGGVSSSSASAMNHCLLAPSPLSQGLGGQCVTDPSLQLRPIHDDNNARVSLSSSTNVVRNPKKRTRASRRAPTTVLTTDTSNFRAMVQEFTGIPAPPFSGSSYSRRLDLLTGSSSLKSSVSHHLDTITSPFYPLRPSPQKLQPHHHQNPLLLSSSPPSPSTLLHNNNMADAIASTTNTANNSSSNHNNNNNNNSINYQLHPPPDLGLPYNHHTQNIMLSMQNHPILTFHQPPPPLHPFGNHGGGFNAKSQSGLSIPSLEDLQGVNQGQVNNNNNNAHLVGSGSGGGSGVSVVPCVHQHVTNSEGMALRGSSDYGGKVGSGAGKMNFSGSGSSNLNSTIEKRNLENNNNNNTRGEGAVDSWICSSD